MEMIRNRVAAVAIGILLLVAIGFQRAQAVIPEHLVKDLPGQPAVKFHQYAGYVDVGEDNSKHLFYWFVEADHQNPASLPIAFWFNGGELIVLVVSSFAFLFSSNFINHLNMIFFSE